jgi:colanic acid/amylovoran biosynthesis glycosyltransferase
VSKRRKVEGPRLVYVTGIWPAPTETFVSGEIGELVRQGEEPQLFAIVRGEGEVPEGLPEARYLVEESKGRKLAALTALLITRPFNFGRAIARARFLGKGTRDVAAIAPFAVAARGGSHIHAHFANQPATVAAILSELAGVPFSFTAHAHDVFVEWDHVEEKLAAARFAVTVCAYNSRFIASRAPERTERLHVILAGADTQRFRRKRAYDPDGPVVAVGRLVEQKGFGDLVEAAAGGGREVLIAGEGPDRGRLERLIAETGAPVRLLGALRHDEVRELYEGASAAVMPCVVAEDGSRDSMPVSLKEAMAMELPVVATNEVGLPELVTPESGVLVPPHNPQALGRAIADLLERPADERIAMGRAGRDHVEEHCNLRLETAKLLELFRLEEAAAEGLPGRPGLES